MLIILFIFNIFKFYTPQNISLNNILSIPPVNNITKIIKSFPTQSYLFLIFYILIKITVALPPAIKPINIIQNGLYIIKLQPIDVTNPLNILIINQFNFI